MDEQLGTLLVSCPDQKGIVAAIAQVLYGQGVNIVDADQHTDPIEELVRKGKDLETRALARAVRLHLQDRILVYSGKTVVFE